MFTAYHIFKNKPVRELADAEALVAALREEVGLIWVDLEDPSEEETAILSNVFGFHDLAVEDCVTGTNQPKLDNYDGYLFLVVHGIVPGSLGNELEPREINIFFNERYVVSVHRTHMRSITFWRSRVDRNQAPLLSKGTDFLVHGIVDTMVDNYEPLLERLDTRMESAEEQIVEGATGDLLIDMLQLKSDLFALTRLVTNQRNTLVQLSEGDSPYISRSVRAYFSDVQDHLIRVRDRADSYSDFISTLQNVHVALVTSRTNDVMKTLTIIATIMLPLTFVTGIFGMNMVLHPYLKGWPGWLGSFLLMLIIMAGMLLYFRRHKWI